MLSYSQQKNVEIHQRIREACKTATVGVADQYMIMIAVTLLFTVLAIAYEKKLTFGLLAAIAWFVSAIGHLAVGDKTSVLTANMPLLFMVFGILFIVEVMIQAADMMRQKRWGTEIE